MSDIKLNAQAVTNFWVNRSNLSSMAPDAGLSVALSDDQLSKSEFESLKQAFLETHPEGDFEAFLADSLDGTLDQQIKAVFHDRIKEMGQAGSALVSIDFEVNDQQDGYRDIAKLTQATPLQALKPASKAQMQEAVHQAIQNSYARVPDKTGESRHRLNQRLQNATAEGSAPGTNAFYDGSDIVVIAFEGTGAFDARRPEVMQEAADLLRDQGLTTKGAAGDSLYTVATGGLKQKSGKEPVWSGLGVGPLDTMLRDADLQKNAQWLSFPSEELEILSSPEAYKDTSPEDLIAEATGSYIGSTPGINHALSALLDIRNQAKAQGKTPKFVIVTHSSGGRSAVKFLERAKSIKGPDGTPLTFPFVMTIDPVREAHEALGEASLEILNKGTEHNMNRVRGVANSAANLLEAGINFFSPFDDVDLEVPQKKVYGPTIGYETQPESLYKTSNTDKHISFLQRRDKKGLKLEFSEKYKAFESWVQFGIYGSPVAGAENTEIKTQVGDSAHGEIAYHPTVVKAFMDNLKALRP